MSKTYNDLAIAALEEIQRAGVDEAPSAEDLHTALDRIPSVFADLLGRRVVLQPIGQNIDETVFDHLVVLLANRIAGRFSVAVAPAMVAGAEDSLRTIYRVNRGTTNILSVDRALTYGMRRPGRL